jgi:hypothetical protein
MPFPVAGTGYQVGDGNELAPNFYIQSAPVSFTTDPAPTALQLAGIAMFIGNPGGAINFTLPTVAALETAYQAMGEKPNVAFEFVIINTNATNAITLQPGTGWTITGAGSMTVALSTSARFQARKTGVGTWQLYRMA